LGVAVFLILGFIVAVSIVIVRSKMRAEESKSWPATVGTIQSGEMEIVGEVELPCFSFSYLVDGEYYSGRFALWASGERAGALIHELTDTKITIKYDPRRPSSFYLAERLIGGCGIAQ
jgi:hypothetical protein